uniref:CX domain-containing protein n=1 Tax=Plectus sambesii TaxID=2011161 RepID=A0A914WI22_9BILA
MKSIYGRGSGRRGSSAGRSSSRGSNFRRGGGVSTFSKGTGIGSVGRSSSLKSAAADSLTYNGGRGTINSPGAAVTWNSRRYYWGSIYYQYRSGYEMCSMPLINSTDDTFSDVVFDNGTQPEMIAWSCHALSEYCCGYECCPSENEPISIWAIIGLVVGTIFLLPVLLWGAFFIWYLVEDFYSGKKEDGKGKKAEEYTEQDRIKNSVTGNENEVREKMAEEEKALMQLQITEIQPDQALENVEQAYPLQPQYPLWVPPPYNSKP